MHPPPLPGIRLHGSTAGCRPMAMDRQGRPQGLQRPGAARRCSGQKHPQTACGGSPRRRCSRPAPAQAETAAAPATATATPKPAASAPKLSGKDKELEDKKKAGRSRRGRQEEGRRRKGGQSQSRKLRSRQGQGHVRFGRASPPPMPRASAKSWTTPPARGDQAPGRHHRHRVRPGALNAEVSSPPWPPGRRRANRPAVRRPAG
jgi:hypothetical protein